MQWSVAESVLQQGGERRRERKSHVSGFVAEIFSRINIDCSCDCSEQHFLFINVPRRLFSVPAQEKEKKRERKRKRERERGMDSAPSSSRAANRSVTSRTYNPSALISNRIGNTKSDRTTVFPDLSSLSEALNFPKPLAGLMTADGVPKSGD